MNTEDIQSAVDVIPEIWDFETWRVQKLVRKKEQGKVVEVLDLVEIQRAYPNGAADAIFYWKETVSAFGEETHVAEVARKEREFARGANLLSVLSGLTSLKLEPSRGWRALACNVVYHPIYGAGVAVATDGAQVLLAESARLEAVSQSYFVAHVTNILGAPTATPTERALWDFNRNKAVSAQQGGRSGVQKPTKPSSVQKALDLLDSIASTL